MRVIGHVSGEEAAASFSGYLHLQGIENEVEPDDGGRFAIWVRSDDQLEAAAAHLGRFLKEPGHGDFRGAARAADQARAREETEVEARAARTFQRNDIWRTGSPHLTIALFLACVAVAVFSKLGEELDPVRPLFISEGMVLLPGVAWYEKLVEVREGQVWRLVTPIFLHFGPAHLIFNMLALLHMGTMIERVCGTRFLAVQVLLLAVASNVGQFITGGPGFGGMSGVLYGLFGYMWMRGRYDSASGLELPHQTVAMMLIWYVICFSGLLPIANTAHTVGLVVGAAWGYLSARRSRHFTG
jgi:GlpG protein